MSNTIPDITYCNVRAMQSCQSARCLDVLCHLLKLSHFVYGYYLVFMLFHFFSICTQLPVLPIQSAPSSAGVRHRTLTSSVTPHPPRRPRPASAGAKRSSVGPNVSEYSGSSHRPGSFILFYLIKNFMTVRVA